MSRSPQRNTASGVCEGMLVQCVCTVCIQHTHMSMGGGREGELKYMYNIVKCFIYCVIHSTVYIVL